MRIYSHTQEPDPRLLAFMAGHTFDKVKMVSSMDRAGQERKSGFQEELGAAHLNIADRDFSDIRPGTHAGRIFQESVLHQLSGNDPEIRLDDELDREPEYELEDDHEISALATPAPHPGLSVKDLEIDEGLDEELGEELNLEGSPEGPEKVVEVDHSPGGWDLHLGDKIRAEMRATNETFNVSSLVQVQRHTLTLTPSPAPRPSRFVPGVSGEVERKGRGKSFERRERVGKPKDEARQEFGGIRLALPGAAITLVGVGAAPESFDPDNIKERIRRQREHSEALRRNLAFRLRQVTRHQERMDRMERHHQKIMDLAVEQDVSSLPNLSL